ncbi:MAG: hypothetical protein H0X62_10955, partial [Bacteroidetes bacterium]|nr:hypothetical protein [Bacteroidota bacterium]
MKSFCKISLLLLFIFTSEKLYANHPFPLVNLTGIYNDTTQTLTVNGSSDAGSCGVGNYYMDVIIVYSNFSPTNVNNIIFSGTSSLGLKPSCNLVPYPQVIISTSSLCSAATYSWYARESNSGSAAAWMSGGNFTVSGLPPVFNLSISASDTIICLGQSVTLSVSSAGTYCCKLIYDWGGFVGDSLIVTPYVTQNFFVTAIDTCTNHQFTLMQTIYVYPSVAIFIHPTNKNVCQGEDAAFSVSAGTSSNLSFQWLKNGIPLPGGTSDTLRLFNVSNADTGQYSVIVMGGCVSLVSNPAILSLGTQASIVNQPTNFSTCNGSMALFSVTATGLVNLSYQWKKDGMPLPGENNSFLYFNNISAVDTGSFSVDIFGCDTVTSNSATLSINPNTTSVLNSAACDSYTLNNQTYTSSGTYFQNLPNAAGCDSTLTLNLIITNSTTSVLIETACNSYT